MFYVISYDISDNRRRQQLAKLLLDYGHRVQKSVFEAELDDRRFLKLKQQIEKLIDWELDSVRYYPICSRCQGNVQVSGWGVIREDEELLIV